MKFKTFTFKGTNSADMGVFISDEWLDSTPATYYEATDIDGADGAFYRASGFKDITKDVKMWLKNSSNKRAVAAWMRGDGILEIYDEFLKKTLVKTVRIYDQIDFSRIVNGQPLESFSVPMIEEPFWYEKNAETSFTTVIENAASGTITNEGNTASLPVIKTTMTSSTHASPIAVVVSQNGAETGRITVNKNTDTSDPTATEIIVDCLSKYESDPLHISTAYNYPKLLPGENQISIINEGNEPVKVEIARKDRWF